MKRFVLTRQEQLLVIFVAIALIGGTIVKHYRAKNAGPLANSAPPTERVVETKFYPSPSTMASSDSRTPARTRRSRKKTGPAPVATAPEQTNE